MFKFIIFSLLSYSCANIQTELKDAQNKVNTIENSISNVSSRTITIDNLQGWSVNPESVLSGNLSLDSLQQDWYYKKFTVSPNPRAIELKSESFIMSSCKRNSIQENSEKLILEAFKTVNSTKENFEINKEDKENVSALRCIYLNSNCECILSYKVKGGQESLKKRFN